MALIGGAFGATQTSGVRVPQAFLIMPIGDAELDNVAASAMIPALVSCGLDPRRVDKHNNGGLLKTEIIEFIETSEIIIADLTLERPNCYLEIGYAMGVDKFRNLILTVREDHFPDSPNFVRGGPKVHFDLAGYDILRWHPQDIDGFRKELEKRVRRRLAIVATPALPVIEPIRSDWFEEQRTLADEGMKKTPRSAYMELSLALASRVEQFSLPDLNKASASAPIHTFGWPIALHMSREEYRPRPRADGIVAEIFPETRDSYDYWALRRNGDFYWRGSLFEDERSANELFVDTRIFRVTEAFLYCGRLYSALGQDRQRVVTINIRHVGLKGRQLSSATRRLLIHSRVNVHENESTYSTSIRLEQIETELIAMVKAAVSPMLALFDFFELGDQVYEDNVNKFVDGKI
jgi:hypothetical protein